MEIEETENLEKENKVTFDYNPNVSLLQLPKENLFSPTSRLSHQQQIQELKENIRNYLQDISPEDQTRLEYAIEDLTRFHAGQQRKSGQPFIIHPLRVAWQICQVGLDVSSVIVALLHDTLEDTHMTCEELEQRYGKWYAEVVEGLTKANFVKNSNPSKQSSQEATYQKILLAMFKDVRVLFIKLFDRLDNIRDLKAMSREKQRRISRETLNVYVPMAKRLGLEEVYREYTEICFQYLYPKRYAQKLTELESLAKDRKPSILLIAKKLQASLSKDQLSKVEISPVLIHISEHVYQKEKIDKILNHFRILAPNQIDCYRVLGVLHSEFQAIPLQFRDFMSNPLWDGYRGLKTEIVVNGERIAIEITSPELHARNQDGIIAYWKKNPTEFGEYYQKYLELLGSVSEDQELRMPDVLRDIQTDQIQVFTPKGKLFHALKGSTILDFAYLVHTELGNSCAGGFVVNMNQEKIRVPIHRQLLDGECIEIIKDSKVKPAKDWLQWVVTAKAKVNIRRFLKHEDLKRCQHIGEKIFHEQLLKSKLPVSTFVDSPQFQQALTTEQLSYEQFLQELGADKLSVEKFLKKYQLISFQQTQNNKLWRKKISTLRPWSKSVTNTQSPQIIVDSINDPFIQIAECCSPLEGEKVFGRINEDTKLEIHENHCKTLKSFTKSSIVSIGWNLSQDEKQSYGIELLLNEQLGTLVQILKVFKYSRVAIRDIHGQFEKENQFVLQLQLEPITRKMYNKIVKKLRTFHFVKNIF